MFCPKCKNEIKDNSLKCDLCGARIGALCKECGHYNLINAVKCKNCGKVLLKICSECGSANLPEAEFCRKCRARINNNQKESKPEAPVYSAGRSTQQRVKSMLAEGIKDADKKIITLSGASGSGKNLVLRSAISELSGAKLIWLMGSCTQITQLSPFGYFQDLLLNFFNINNFCPDTLQLKKNSVRFFKQDFPTLKYSEILDLLNLLYPDSTDKYENIYYNKTRMFSILKKVITTIVEKTKVVFIADKFENIDGMSYDFIKEIIDDEYISKRSKFIFICTEPKPGLGLINTESLGAKNYLDLSISNFTQAQCEEFLKQYNCNFDKNTTSKFFKMSDGVPANIEQIIFLQSDIEKYGLKNIEYNTIDAVIEYRLKILKQQNMKAYRMLVAMAVLGAKSYPAILENFDNGTPEVFENTIEYLVISGFITRLNNLSFEFKTESIWKTVISFVKNDEMFEEILNYLYDLLKSYKQSSPAILGYISQKLGDNNQALDIWTVLMKYASYIGDIGLYIIVQKQALKLIENKNNDYYKKIKKNIYTRIGKLLEPINSESALEYLQKAVIMIEDDEDLEHIELLGYIASCAMKTGNYFGAIECVDGALNKIPSSMTFEKTIIKSRTITPLLKLGNYGQLVNEVENEILPEIEKFLFKGKDHFLIDLKGLFELWLGLYFDLAESLVFQGNNRAFEIIQTIYEIIEKNKNTEASILCRANLLLALANTTKGDISTSKQILDDMLKEYSPDSMDSYIVSRWNFIDILNKFFEKDYATMQTELFNVVAYANNINDSFTKNILKTLLAKILKSNSQTKKALEILDEQVAYFAKEKIATGVLLCWYLIAEIKLATNGTQFALDVVTRALDICQSPNINNYYFTALFNKLIGEIYITKQDFESAKVYLEKALFVAKQFDLEYIQVKTYLQCAKLYQELALPKSNNRTVYIKQALKMFQSAKNVPIVSTQTALQKEIKEELNILTSFCKLNGIVLKRTDK